MCRLLTLSILYSRQNESQFAAHDVGVKISDNMIVLGVAVYRSLGIFQYTWSGVHVHKDCLKSGRSCLTVCTLYTYISHSLLRAAAVSGEG